MFVKLKIDATLVLVHKTKGLPTYKYSVSSPDIRSNKPIAIHDQAVNYTGFFQKLIKTKIG